MAIFKIQQIVPDNTTLLSLHETFDGGVSLQNDAGWNVLKVTKEGRILLNNRVPNNLGFMLDDFGHVEVSLESSPSVILNGK